MAICSGPLQRIASRLLKPDFDNPPRLYREGNAERRVGVELEMANVSLEVMADTVVEHFGGEVRRQSAFHYQVVDSRAGDFEVELDASVLKSQRYRKLLQDIGIELKDDASESLDQRVSDLAGLVVPHELVAPPIPIQLLPELDALRAALHGKGAKGTHGSVFYAFGLQINTEIATRDTDWLTRMLRAFFVLNEELVERGRIDFARKLSPYISAFPGRYRRLVLDPDYRPDQATLIDDYLKANPTRNRPLDMLPLFAWLDRDRVAQAPVEHDLIKPRPTFHYRLPNCQIDDAGWNLSLAWNDWVRVERLAEDAEQLDHLAALALSTWDERLKGLSDPLRQRLEKFFS